MIGTRHPSLGALVLAAGLGVLVLAGGCASGPRGAGSIRATGVLKLHCAVPDAVVWVDDRMVAAIGEMPGGLRLRTGAHRVEVRHDGHHTRYLEVEVHPGEARVVEVILAEDLD